MNKTAFSLLVIGIALAQVLVSGAEYGARADCGLSPGCLPHISLPSFSLCCHATNSGDKDKATHDMDYTNSSGKRVDRDLGIYLKTDVDQFGDDEAFSSISGKSDPDPMVRNMPYQLQPASEAKGLFSYKRF